MANLKWTTQRHFETGMRISPIRTTRPWRIYLTTIISIVCVFTGMRLVWPDNETVVNIAGLLEIIVVIPHGVVCFTGIIRNKPQHRRIWLLLASSPIIVLCAIGFGMSNMASANPHPFPATSDWLLTLSLFMVVIFFGSVSHRQNGGDKASIIDATMVAAAFALLSWTFVVSPHITHDVLSLPAKFNLFMYPIMDSMIVWFLARMFFDQGRAGPVVRSCLLAGVFVFGSDVLMVTLYVNEMQTSVWFAFCGLGWGIANTLAFGSALHPEMVSLMKPVTRRQPLGAHKRLAIVFVAALMAPAVILIENQNRVTNNTVAALAAILMFGLVVLRIHGMLRRQEATTKELDETLRRLQATAIQLRHAQKLEAVGKLAAGMAHEINTPIQTVRANLHFLRSSFDTLQSDEPVDAEEVEYLRQDVPCAFNDADANVDRVADIINAMREFGKPSSDDSPQLVDTAKAIQNALTITANEVESVADVSLDLGADVPELSCFANDFNHILLNLVVNAAHAIDDDPRDARGVITISTRATDRLLELRISDTGVGIPDDVLPHIYEPFFTTKEVGRGRGQGLATVWNLVERQGGTIEVETEVGTGTTFLVRLPLVYATKSSTTAAFSTAS
jgi:signal transduction histidine kinase